jgi:hypothetical protein
MKRRISLSMLLRVIGGLVVLCGAAASPAVAKHHHHVASHHHGSQGGTSAVGSDAKGASETNEKDTKEGRKDDGKGSTAEGTPPEHLGNTKPETNGKGETHVDDHGGKTAGSEQNPIDTSNTITGPPPFARQFKKTAAGPKRWTHRVKTVSKGITKHSFVRNAIGQRVELKQAAVDPKGHGSKIGDPPTVNGTRGYTDPPATSGTGAVAPNLHPKPVVLIWSLGRPNDQPPNIAAYRAALTRLNGLGMIRAGAGTGAIGGGTNLNTGVLNGSSFHPKQR